MIFFKNLFQIKKCKNNIRKSLFYACILYIYLFLREKTTFLGPELSTQLLRAPDYGKCAGAIKCTTQSPSQALSVGSKTAEPALFLP